MINYPLTCLNITDLFRSLCCLLWWEDNFLLWINLRSQFFLPWPALPGSICYFSYPSKIFRGFFFISKVVLLFSVAWISLSDSHLNEVAWRMQNLRTVHFICLMVLYHVFFICINLFDVINKDNRLKEDYKWHKDIFKFLNNILR